MSDNIYTQAFPGMVPFTEEDAAEAVARELAMFEQELQGGDSK